MRFNRPTPQCSGLCAGVRFLIRTRLGNHLPQEYAFALSAGPDEGQDLLTYAKGRQMTNRLPSPIPVAEKHNQGVGRRLYAPFSVHQKDATPLLVCTPHFPQVHDPPAGKANTEKLARARDGVSAVGSPWCLTHLETKKRALGAGVGVELIARSGAQVQGEAMHWSWLTVSLRDMTTRSLSMRFLASSKVRSYINFLYVLHSGNDDESKIGAALASEGFTCSLPWFARSPSSLDVPCPIDPSIGMMPCAEAADADCHWHRRWPWCLPAWTRAVSGTCKSTSFVGTQPPKYGSGPPRRPLDAVIFSCTHCGAVAQTAVIQLA